MGLNPTKKVVRDFCTDKARNFSFDQLCELAALVPETRPDDLLDVFKLIDGDGDGHLTLEELRKALMGQGERMTEKEVNDAMAEFDADGDGVIDYQEVGIHFARSPGVGSCLAPIRIALSIFMRLFCFHTHAVFYGLLAPVTVHRHDCKPFVDGHRTERGRCCVRGDCDNAW